MLPIVTLSVPLLLLVIVISGVHSVDPPITCEAGNFTAGEPGHVICNFHTNITDDIAMTRYPLDTPSHRGKDVIVCRWLPKKREHDCFVMANYTFDGILTDHLTVRIPAVSAEQAGLYRCYFVPSEETPAQSCELRVQVRPDSTTTTTTTTTITTPTSKGEDSGLLLIILTCVLGSVAVASFGVLFFSRRRRAGSRVRRCTEIELHETTQPMSPEVEPTQDERKEEIILKGFQLSNSKLLPLMTILAQDMAKGLSDKTRSEADIKMFPTFVSPLFNSSVCGVLLVLDLVSTHLKASLVNLLGKYAKINKSLDYPIPDGIKCGTVSQLFDFVADCTNTFINDEFLFGKIPLALIVGFPCKHENEGKGCLVKWTKELSYSGTGSRDLQALLWEAFDKRERMKWKVLRSYNLRNLEIAAVVNDAVSSMMSVASYNSNCKIGLVLDSGFNACYTEDWKCLEMGSTAGVRPREMIINTELGALGENGCLDFWRTDYDKELDKYSSIPGSQIMEKMVGGRYIGEIVRLVLEGMTREDLLFGTVLLTWDLFQKDSITTESVIIIERDTEEPYQQTSWELDRLDVTNYTEDDLKTVRLVCRFVCERAAYLAAASLATLVNHINQPEVTVVVDGYLYQSHPRFHDLMYSKTLELLNPGLKFYLESPICDRSVGAAQIAAASFNSRDK